MWERWDGIYDGAFHPHQMNAFDHIGLAAAGAWLLERLAGIAPAADGYRRVRLEPVLDRAIGGMRARYHSASGPIGVTWRFEGDGIRYCASLPCGTEGELRLPCDLGDIRVVRGEAGIAGRRCADGVTTLDPAVRRIRIYDTMPLRKQILHFVQDDACRCIVKPKCHPEV